MVTHETQSNLPDIPPPGTLSDLTPKTGFVLAGELTQQLRDIAWLDAQQRLGIKQEPDEPIPHYASRALNKIDQGISARSVFGTFESPVIMQNKTYIAPARYGDPTSLGNTNENLLAAQTLANREFALFYDVFKLPRSESLKRIRTKHFLAEAPHDTEMSTIFYAFLHDQHASMLPGASLAVLSFAMSRDAAKGLIELVRRYPTAAEFFVSTSASGFEYDMRTETGLKRVASDEIVVLNLERIPNQWFQSNSLLNTRSKLSPQIAVSTYGSQIQAMFTNGTGNIYNRYPYGRDEIGKPITYGIADPWVLQHR